jgi:hypothetical protein
MVPRRSLLLASLTLPLAMPPARAQQRRSLADPLRLGADAAVFDSGLARALQQAFGRDTGVVVQVDRRQALPMLDALERGELDAALSNVPEAETRLEAQGLVHDRRAIADGAFVIVGPAPRGKARDPASLAGGHDGAAALVSGAMPQWRHPGHCGSCLPTMAPGPTLRNRRCGELQGLRPRHPGMSMPTRLGAFSARHVNSTRIRSSSAASGWPREVRRSRCWSKATRDCLQACTSCDRSASVTRRARCLWNGLPAAVVAGWLPGTRAIGLPSPECWPGSGEAR